MADTPTPERSDAEILEADARSDIDAQRAPSADDPAMGMAYTSDDSDRQRDGVHATPISEGYERLARRDDLARRLEGIVADAAEWLRESDDDDAQAIYDDLQTAYERLSAPLEETDVHR